MADNTETKTSIVELDRDYRGMLSPFRVEIDRGVTGGDVKSKNTFSLTDYRWYPDGIESFLQDDMYHISDNALLKDNDMGIFGGISIKDISSMAGINTVVKQSASYAGNQFKGVIDSVGGLFSDKTAVPLIFVKILFGFRDPLPESKTFGGLYHG